MLLKNLSCNLTSKPSPALSMQVQKASRTAAEIDCQVLTRHEQSASKKQKTAHGADPWRIGLLREN